jgi:hypothetical protein
MTEHVARPEALTATPIWTHLSPDRRVRTVRLLAQLASACAVTPVPHPGKETTHVVAVPNRQDPPRPS